MIEITVKHVAGGMEIKIPDGLLIKLIDSLEVKNEIDADANKIMAESNRIMEESNRLDAEFNDLTRSQNGR